MRDGFHKYGISIILKLILGIFLLNLMDCALLQRTSRIKPIPFDYKSIGDNYFTPQNSKPFPLTIQRGNNLYNTTTQDGNYLFYATDKDGNFDIWFRDLGSSIIVPVTQHPSQEYKPAISPDGKKLVFVSEQYDSEGDLVLLRMDMDDWVSSSLKGKRFINQNFHVLTNPNYKDNSQQQRVIDTDPAWMPDSRRLVFSSDRFSPGIQNLILLDVEAGNKMKKLTYQGGSSPFVSSDGETIYFISYRDSELGEIYSLNVSTEEIRRITNNRNLDFSPSVSKDNKYLYYTSIREDTNRNGILDERDNSYIVQRSLSTGQEKFLSSGESSVFDTKYSNFNGGSILFSATFYNSINVYFIPYTGSIPKQENIVEQFNYSLEYEDEKNSSRYFLALDSVELFYEDDPLFPFFEARVEAKKINYLRSNNQDNQAKTLLKNMSSQTEGKNALALAYSYILDPGRNPKAGELIQSLYKRTNPENGELRASLLHIQSEWEESKKLYKDMISTLELIQKNYPNYHLIREVKNKYGYYEFNSKSIVIPKYYIESIADYEKMMQADQDIPRARKMEMNDLIQDILKKIRMNKSPDEILAHVSAIQSSSVYPKDSVILSILFEYIKADAYQIKKDLDQSTATIDRVIPIPENLDLYPLGQKSLFEIPMYIKMYRNPALSYIHKLKYKNSRDKGDHHSAKRHLQIFMEFYDPITSPDIEEEDLTYLFNYWENKAIEYERLGDLYQASIHYYFNNLGIALAKSKNLSQEKIYETYGVYYQRKMLDTVFKYGQSLRQKEEEQLLAKMNILGEKNLDVLGNLSDIMTLVQSLPFLDALKFLGDFRDLQKKDVLHENATKLSDLYFNYHLEKNRPFLNLAIVYGYAYYLINRSVINETALYERGEMTEARKIEILQNYKRAEYELRWILFADPTFPDAYQLLGWLYQHIDIIKAKKINEKSLTDEEIFASAYERYFPEKNFEENVELYTQILEFLGEDYPNKKILSDINLNLGNNYFLLSNYPKANESAEHVDSYGKYIVSRAQFDNYKQEAVFRYNYGRSSLYRSNYKKAIEQFNIALNIYTTNEYYQSLANSNQDSKGMLEDNEEFVEVKGKLALLNALIGLSYMEMNQFEESIAPIQTAISHNRTGKELNDLNLWNALAIAYQKTGRYKESIQILERAELSYEEEKKSIKGRSYSLGDYAWNILLPDNIRVMGDGRFPGEFPLHFKGLLTKSIRINNYINQKDYHKALNEIESRDELIENHKLKKWVMGNLVSQNANSLKGQIYFDSGQYEKSYLEFSNYRKKSIESNNFELGKSAIRNQSYSLFAFIERDPVGIGYTQSLELKSKYLLENENFLKNFRKKYLDFCEQEQSSELCRKRFQKEFVQFELLLGLNYFYRGDVALSMGDTPESFLHYGEALTYLSNPGKVDSSVYMLKSDPLSRRERIRNMLNLSRLYLRLGNLRLASQFLKNAEEYSYEFRLEEEQFVANMVRYELESFSGYDKSSPRAKKIEGLLKSSLNQYKQEELLYFELPKHLESDFFGLLNQHSLTMGREWDVPKQRDMFRKKRLGNEVIKSSLEYSNLEWDALSKQYYNYLNELIQTQKSIEGKSIQRLNIDRELKKKKQLKIQMLEVLNKIETDYPKYKSIYSPFELKSTKIPSNSLYIRCLEDSKNINVWIKDSITYKYLKQAKNSDGLLNLDSLLSSQGQNPENPRYKQIYLNPDNCYSLYKQAQERAHKNIGIVTKDSDVDADLIKPAIQWRWRTVLSNEEKEDETRIRYLNKEYLDFRLLDTDLLYVTNPDSSNQLTSFSFQGVSGLNLREIFTNRSEITAVVLEEKDTVDWDRLADTWDLMQIEKSKNLILTSPLTDSIRKQMRRTTIPDHSLVFGYIPDRILSLDPESRYKELRQAGVFQERSKNYQSAYDLYYQAGAYILFDDEKSNLENSVDLARVKRRIFPDLPPDYFFRSLIRENKGNKENSNYIYSIFLPDCFSDRLMKKQRSACEIYYYDWRDSDPASSASAVFFYRMYMGLTRGIQDDLRKALESPVGDEFIRKMQISDLFLENFMFEDSIRFAKLAEENTVSPREKTFVKNRLLEIDYHRSFVMGESDFAYKKIPAGTTYALGHNREWNAYLNRVYSPTFVRLGESDNIYEDYRRRMYQAWRDWEFGEEFESTALVPDELYGGGSVLSKLSHTNRSLYFYLIMESSKHQIFSESDILMDQLIQQEEKEGFYNRAFLYSLFYADQLMRNGFLDRSSKYLKYFEDRYDSKREFHPILESEYSYILMKMSRYSDKVKFPKEYINRFDSNDREVYNSFLKIKNNGVKGFAEILNQYLHSRGKSGKPFTLKSRRKVNDLIQYMKNISLNLDSTEGFLDAIHFEQVLKAYNERSLGRKPYFKDMPYFRSVSEDLIKRIPENQELSVVNDYNNQTYIIQVSDGKTKGRILFEKNQDIKSSMRTFHRALNQGGSEARIRETLGDRYKNSIRLNNQKINYLYLTDYHLNVPFLQGSESNIYHIQNMESLLKNRPIKKKDLEWMHSKYKKVSETKFSENWFNQLKSIEDWELLSVSKPSGRQVTVSQEEIRIDELGRLVFGGVPVAVVGKSKSKRDSFWITSSNQLGYAHFLSNDLNSTLYHLDSIHTGPGILSIEDQSDFYNTYFMKSMLESRSSDINAKYRFLQARESTRNRYPFDRYWTGFRIYTSSIILP